MKIVENGKLSDRGERYQTLAAEAIDEIKHNNEQLVQASRLVWGPDGRLKVPDNREEAPPLFHLFNKIQSLMDANPAIAKNIAHVIAATLREAPSAPLSDRLAFLYKIGELEALSREQDGDDR